MRDKRFNSSPSWLSAFTVSEALDYKREYKQLTNHVEIARYTKTCLMLDLDRLLWELHHLGLPLGLCVTYKDRRFTESNIGKVELCYQFAMIKGDPGNFVYTHTLSND